jgi:hypothetical protein
LERIANDNDDNDVIESLLIQKVNNCSESNTNSTHPEVKDKSNLKIYCQMNQLESSFNPVAISDAEKEMKYLYFLLQNLGVELDLPIVVKTDNIRALLLQVLCSQIAFIKTHVITIVGNL